MHVFLFTDIEGSTRRWEDAPEVMPDALAWHDALLHSAVEFHGGSVFKHTGDGICAVFPDATEAVSAAMVAQRQLADEQQEAEVALRVRMAIHAGTAQARGGDFFGPTLNRTARLMALGHGGQVLLSGAAAELISDGSPPGADLVDLGEHSLADLSKPEHVFQVADPHLTCRFPPLRSAGPRRHNLPIIGSPFIGRRLERDDVGRLVTTSPLVTLIGAGGAGKTRLAVEVAARAIEAFPDGVFFVDLAPISEPSMVVPRVIATLGLVMDRLEDDMSSAGLAVLVDHLGSRRTLLVMDNCEHLIGEVAGLCTAMVAGCRRVAILATSREPLGVLGEVAWRVPSLSLPPAGDLAADVLTASDAVALFSDRARTADPDFRLGPDNAEVVVEICRRLDGIPLALELAAARLRVLSPHQLAARLGDRLRLLTSGARGAVSRHQTLRATLDWGHDLLSEAERNLLRRLSVFRGSFALPAAGAVAGGAGCDVMDVLDDITGLVEKSWLAIDHNDREPRFRLPEIVREYAEEKLAATGEADAIRQQHRDFYLELVDAGIELFAKPASNMRLIQQEHDNLRAGLEWSFAAGDAEATLRFTAGLWVYWVLAGQVLEAVPWLERALTLPGGGSARVGTLNGLGNLLMQLGDHERAESCHREASILAAALGDVAGGAAATGYLGVLRLRRGEREDAERLFEEARAGLESIKGSSMTGWIDFNLGWVNLAGGQVGEAGRYFRRALEAWRPVDADILVAHTLVALALVEAVEGRSEKALALADEAVEASRKLNLTSIVAMALTRVAEVGVALDQPEKAAAALRELLPMLRDMGARAWVPSSLEAAAVAVGARGQMAGAIRILGAAESVRQESGETGRWGPLAAAVDACRDDAEQALARTAADHERQQGRQMTLDAALAFASQSLR
jgi:predicted ATPase/class 3 adenylate cyclase